MGKVEKKLTGEKVRKKNGKINTRNYYWKNYGKKTTRKKYGGKSTGKYGKTKYEKKSKGTSHVTSGDVTSGQACAMVRSSLILRKYYFFHAHILLLWVPTVSQFASLFFYSYGADFIQGIFKKIKKS